NDEFAILMDEVPSGVIVLDAKGKVVKINDAARRIARIPVDESKPLEPQAVELFRIRYPDGRPVPIAEIPSGRALRGEPTAPLDYVFTAAGEEVRVRVSTRTLRGSDGGVRGAMFVFTELGARRIA